MLKHTANHTKEVKRRIQPLKEELHYKVHPSDKDLLFTNPAEGLTFGGGFHKFHCRTRMSGTSMWNSGANKEANNEQMTMDKDTPLSPQTQQ